MAFNPADYVVPTAKPIPVATRYKWLYVRAKD